MQTEFLNLNFKIGYNESYDVIISFINTKNTIIARQTYAVKDEKGIRLYLDKCNYLKNMYEQTLFYKKTHKDVDSQTDIKDISPSLRYYCYVKIQKDYNNSSNNGKTMIFYFGKKIKDMIEEYINGDNNKLFSNTFYLSVKKMFGYLNYDSSYFMLEKDITITDYSLNIEDEIKFKAYVPTYIRQRREKLLNLSKE